MRGAMVAAALMVLCLFALFLVLAMPPDAGSANGIFGFMVDR